MALVETWEPGHLYLVGALVRPLTTGPAVAVAITNPGFESGDTLWTKETGWTIINSGHKFQGSWSAEFNSTTSVNRVYKTAASAVTPGTSITAWCMVDQGAAAAGVAGAGVLLRWLNAALAEISVSEGNLVTSSSGGWKKSTVTAVAPPLAVWVQIGARGFRNSGSEKLWVDSFAWNLLTQSTLAGFLYQNVAAAAGHSGAVEPVWPVVLAGTIADNECTWEAVYSNRVVWEASPVMETGSSQPTWPTVPGTFVSDGDVSWEAMARNVKDVNCPNSTVVAIAASHVWAGDDDIVRFSAAANPLDWTTEQNAGYLPTGLQQQGANSVAVLNIYRSNLAVLNAAAFQMWQIDPDPAINSLLDQLSGLGSVFQQAAAPVGDELYFLSALGVRSIGVTAGSSNVASGDIGAPVDDLVRAKILTTIAAGRRPVATYVPGAGQYWIAFA